jgi:hypothetical protein
MKKKWNDESINKWKPERNMIWWKYDKPENEMKWRNREENRMCYVMWPSLLSVFQTCNKCHDNVCNVICEMEEKKRCCEEKRRRKAWRNDIEEMYQRRKWCEMKKRREREMKKVICQWTKCEEEMKWKLNDVLMKFNHESEEEEMWNENDKWNTMNETLEKWKSVYKWRESWNIIIYKWKGNEMYHWNVYSWERKWNGVWWRKWKEMLMSQRW